MKDLRWLTALAALAGETWAACDSAAGGRDGGEGIEAHDAGDASPDAHDESDDASPDGQAAMQVTLWDLVGELAPAAAERTVGFFKDSSFSDDPTDAYSGCALTYRLDDDGTIATWGTPGTHFSGDGARELRDAVVWSAATWLNSRLPESIVDGHHVVLDRTLSAFCSPRTRLTTNGSTLTLAYDQQTGAKTTVRAYTLTIAPGRVLMQVNSNPHFTELFGNLFYRRNAMATWSNLLVSKRLDWRSLRDFESLTLEFSGTLERKTVRTSPISSEESPEATVEWNRPYAVRAASESSAGAHFRIPVQLRWRGRPELGCAQRTESGTCSRYGRPIVMTLNLYWRRYTANGGVEEASDGYLSRTTFRQDGNTGWYTYVPSIKEYIVLPTPQAAQNPFSQVAVHGVMRMDVLEAAREVLLAAYHSNSNDPNLPSPLTIGGERESFDDYVADFGIGSFNLGFEVSDLGTLQFEIDDFFAKGVLRSEASD